MNYKTLTWVFTTYFMQGLPFTLVRIFSGVFFTGLGVKEQLLGALNFLNLPWNLKFLWAPLLDSVGTMKQWMLGIQFLIGLSAAAFAFGLPWMSIPVMVLMFILMAFLAATNDIAIDGYYLTAIQTPADQAQYSGYRVFAYRLSMLFVRSGVVALLPFFAAISSDTGQWQIAFGTIAATIFLLTLFHTFYLPDSPPPAEKKKRDPFSTSFKAFLAQPLIAWDIAFIILYKIGDEVMFSMATPFFLRELAVTKAQYALFTGVIGLTGTIVGAILGGIWIGKVGLRKAVWPMTLIMNGAITLYLLLAIFKPPADQFWGVTTIGTVHFLEQVAAGLGTQVLLLALIQLCVSDFKASHYAIGSALMSVPATILGGLSGEFVARYEYTGLYTAALLLTIPSMIILWTGKVRVMRDGAGA